MASSQLSTIMLTTGGRPREVHRALRSIGRQKSLTKNVLLVGNGCEIELAGDGVSDLAPPTLTLAVQTLPRNIGIPAARNFGSRIVAGRALVFLDDDAELLDDRTFQEILVSFDQHPDLAAVALRLVDEEGVTARRHVPRLGGRGARHSGWVAAFPGGAVAMRREAMEAVGGYADEFFYGMEETDLAVRLIDAGWKIWYAADLRVFHPRTDPSRHQDAYWRLARNRVWLAHRNFPVPVAVVYLTLRALLTIARQPSLARSQLSGYRDGWRTRIGPRRPISWRTVWRLTRLGRAPIL